LIPLASTGWSFTPTDPFVHGYQEALGDARQPSARQECGATDRY